MSNLKELGIALRAYRIAAGESIDELADATELASDTLKKMEAGLQKPNDTVLEMLARHFSLRDQEVKRLVELAGHDTDKFNFEFDLEDIDLSNIDEEYDVLFAPIFYTDMIKVVNNEHGITVNFIQRHAGEKPIIVSRVGMSHKHAESMIAVLQDSLKRAKQMEMDDGATPSNSDE